MREHPLVPIIRFYIALAALVVIAALLPEWGLMFLATGFGWWKGCGCCSPACVQCTSGSAPSTVQVDLSGFVDDSCTSCNESYNGSFIVPFNASLSGVNFCRWTYTFPSSCSPFGFLLVQLSAANLSIQIMQSFSGSVAYSWSLAVGSPDANRDCSSWSGLHVPWETDTFSFITHLCTGDHSAALVTAL